MNSHLFQELIMNVRAVWITIAIISTLVILAGCGGTETVSSTGNVEGNCIGRITDNSGAPVAGASVMLVPDGYTPGLSEENMRSVVSTTTNASGQYGFDVATSGKYNLLSNNAHQYVLRKEIPVKAGQEIELPDEQLHDPGTLSGIVELEGMSDHQSAIILLPGTNIFTTPSDPSGSFSISALASGTYTLKVLTMESGFSVAERTVVIESGKKTDLSIITVSRKEVPSISSFTVDYDPLMMDVTLTWTVENSHLIDSFFIYCNREQNLSPVMKTGSDVTTAFFDHITTPLDTYRYSIAIIGKDGWERQEISGKSFINNGAFTGTEMPTTFSGSPASSVDPVNTPVACFTEDGFYLYEGPRVFFGQSGCRITKYGNDMTIEKSVDFEGFRMEGSSIMGLDSEGNIYALLLEGEDVNNSPYIYKFNRDLMFTDKLSLATARKYSLAVASTGTVLLYGAGYREKKSETANLTNVVVLDQNLEIVSETRYADNRTIEESYFYNDSVITIIASDAWSENHIVYFDASFKEIGTNTSFGNIEVPVPAGYSKVNDTKIHICSEALFVNRCANKSDRIPTTDDPPAPHTILYFFNSSNDVVARYPIEEVISERVVVGYEQKLDYDGNGNIFKFKKNTMFRYSLELPAD